MYSIRLHSVIVESNATRTQSKSQHESETDFVVVFSEMSTYRR